MMRALLGLVIAAAILAPAAWSGQIGGQPPPPERKAPPAVKGGVMDISGAMSGIRQPRNVVVRDEKAFEALWKEHAQGREMPRPQVDFKKYDVVGIFAGMKNTGGYSVELGDIKRDAKSATVHGTLWKPAPGAMVIQIITYPFALRAVPKLPPTVRFDIKEQARK